MITIRPAIPADASQLAQIYKHYVENSIVTFGEKPLSDQDFAEQITLYSLHYPYLVAENEGTILGYANAHAFRQFSAYRKTAEVAIFLRHDNLGGGVGRQLYGTLLEALKTRGFHVVIAVLTVPNIPSEKLQIHFGFERVGQMREVGFKFGNYIDAVIWQKIL